MSEVEDAIAIRTLLRDLYAFLSESSLSTHFTLRNDEGAVSVLVPRSALYDLVVWAMPRITLPATNQKAGLTNPSDEAMLEEAYQAQQSRALTEKLGNELNTQLKVNRIQAETIATLVMLLANPLHRQESEENDRPQ